MKKELAEAQFEIASRENTEKSLKFKLDKIKGEKNDEINRLKEALAQLKEEFSQTTMKNDEKLAAQRALLI